jgi:4-amino-4-deoxy-L-arabinose transferase-like glycosyltransferase
MKDQKHGSSFLSYWLATLLFLLAGLWLRIVNPMEMPVQWLEGWSIYLAQNVLEGRIYSEPAEAMRWFSGPVHALLYPVGPEGIWLLRIFSGLLGLISVAVCMRLGRELNSRFAGLIAAGVYVVLPFTVFHERQAIIDPIQAVFTSLALLFSVMLAKRPQLVWAILTGLMLGGAFLTKVSALPFLGIPTWAILLLSSKYSRSRALLLSAVAVGLAVIVIVGGLFPFTRYNPQLYPTVRSVLLDPFIGLSPVDHEANQAKYLQSVQKSLGQAVENIYIYMGVGMTGLVFASLLTLRYRPMRREILFLAVPALIFPLAPIFSDSSRITYRDTYFAARYILTSAVPLVIMAAIVLKLLLDTSGYKRGSRAQQAAGLAALVSILVPALLFDRALIYDPLHAPLPGVDRWQYITGRPSGVGYDRAAQTILNIWRDERHTVNIIATGNAMQLRGYLGPAVGEIIEYRSRDEDQIDMLAQWLAEGDIVVFFDGNLNTPLPANPHGAQLEVVGSYPTRWDNALNVYRVVGAEPQLAERISTR